MAAKKVGVYAIRNVITGECYIGSSRNIQKRWHDHRYYLRRGTSEHPLLQEAWIRYGESCFELLVLERCLINELLDRENRWLIQQPQYNTYLDSRGRGKSQATRDKVSRSKMGHSVSSATRKKISDALMGTTHSRHTEESKRKISEARKRYFQSLKENNNVC